MPPRPVRKSMCCRPGRAGKGFVAVLVVGIIAAAVIREARGPRRPSLPPEPRRLDTMNASRLARHLAETGPTGAAEAADKWLAAQAPATPPAPGAVMATTRTGAAPARPAGLFVKARGGPHLRADQAEAEALEVAAKMLMQQFVELNPPLTAEVTAADVRAKYLKPDTIAVVKPTPKHMADWEEAKLETDRVWVTLDAEVTPSQVRELRSHGRVWLAVRGVGMVLACLAAAAAFFRLDALTRGYLSWGLGLGLAGAAAGAVAGLWLLV